MLQQALDFKSENDALYGLLEGLDVQDYARETLFKSWTVNDVVSHLHFFNMAADLSLTDEQAFLSLVGDMKPVLGVKDGLRIYANNWLDGARGPDLLEIWRKFATEMSGRFATSDPKHRLKWFGPDMSVLSSITARLMETWAHGQELYDLFGQVRVDQDRIRNIAHLGVATFGWTFRNRGLAIPETAPHVRLTAPSGAIWEWNAPDATCSIKGSAVDFCQVVTQVRNIADTSLELSGDVAERWMDIAQCFAGPPEDPPLPGIRFTNPL